ncbi:MAG TPA: lysophospholipid acyltransferase family protein [Geminicoccaceae bacterium]|nr:lysophospholipid acyltransferase family protein [Geminicoccaceae bacterium]
MPPASPAPTDETSPRPLAPDAAWLGLVARSVAFNAAMWLWTAVMCVALMPLLLTSPETMMRGVRSWMRGIQLLLRTLVGLRYEVRGLEHLPPGPAIIAAKHQSAWETLSFNLIVPDLVVALKRELLQLPFFGWFARKSRMIGVDRRHGTSALRNLVRQAEVAMARGERVLIFPEGTRVPPGQRARYLPGVAALYGKLDRPVVPVALNSGLYWGRRRFVKRPGRIVVEFLPPIPPGLDRRAFEALLAERLETATDRLVEEARGGNRGGEEAAAQRSPSSTRSHAASP